LKLKSETHTGTKALLTQEQGALMTKGIIDQLTVQVRKQKFETTIFSFQNRA
jgi:hypothetical protein